MSNEIYYTPSIVSEAHIGGVALPRADRSVHPAEDFYKYINHEWQRHVHLPSYIGGFGVSEEIEREVEEELLTLIHKLQTKHPKHPLAILATSFLHSSAQINSIVDIQRILGTFQCITDKEGLASAIGSMNKIQCRAPLSFTISCDPYNSSKCVVFLYEPYLGLPRKNHYNGGQVLDEYRHTLKELSRLFHLEHLESSIAIETEIIPFLSSGGDLGDIHYYYNPHTLKELEEKYTAIPWKTMLRGWGLHSEDATFIVTNQKYLRHLNHLFHAMDYESWRIWMNSMVILNFLEYLPPPYDDLHFELFGKTLRGIAEKLPQKYLTLKVLRTFATQDLGNLYVQHQVPAGLKKQASQMAQTLLNATVERLKNVEWMTAETRKTAIHKVRAMKFQVGYPEHWDSEVRGIHLYDDRPLLNIFTLSTADTVHMIEDLRRSCKKRVGTWNDGVFEVNAYYYAEGNMMVVPAGILRFPFFDMKRSLAWNYGGIGTAIGHEITHGFDDDGRFFDQYGNYNNWWSDHDSRQFADLTRSLVALYDGVKYMGGKVDGELTLSENLADLGGLAISLHALQSQLPADTAVRKKAYRDFFTSYAVSWRNKDRAKKAKQSLSMDVHAPAHLRVNFVVRQFAEFYEAFGIGPDEKGVIPPEKRIRLW